jgi:chromate transporter
MVLALAAVYVHFGQLSWIHGMFYGIGAAVSAIIVRSAWRLIQKTLGKDYLLWTVFAILAITTVWTESEMLSLFVLSGLVAMLIKAPPKAQGVPAKAIVSPLGFVGMYAPAGAKTVMTVFFFFLKAGAFVFGSGLAIVPFLYGGVVNGFHWLTERQFLDAVAVAMITPGPVVITSGFIGYLVAGPLGAFAATLAVFLPPYLLVVRSAVLPPVRQESSGQSICSRGDGGGCGSDCRCSNHFEQTSGNGFPYRFHCCGLAASVGTLPENTRTTDHSRSGDRRHDCETRLVVTLWEGI